ncbi:HK97 gp10 family phage protein [Leuconostoc mesenteroides]
MNDEDDILGLNEWLNEANKLVELTIEEREEINQAGSEVLQEAISKATKDKKHYSNRQVSKKDIKHLADSVIAGDLEGDKPSGNVSVGYSVKDANHARIARFLNDGTKKLQGDSFYDEAVEHSEDAVEQAKVKKYNEIMDRKGAGK